MKLFRPQRVGQLIRDELAALFLREIEIAGALPTITDVEVSKDLEHAKVKVSVLPTTASPKVLKILNKARARFQFELLRKINIRPMPQITFEIDYGLANAAAVEKNLMDDKMGE